MTWYWKIIDADGVTVRPYMTYARAERELDAIRTASTEFYCIVPFAAFGNAS